VLFPLITKKFRELSYVQLLRFFPEHKRMAKYSRQK